MFNNLKLILHFLKNQKNLKRIFFFENYFIEDHYHLTFINVLIIIKLYY